MRNVHVRFGLAPRAQTELAFAVDLARRISARLFVWTERDRGAHALIEGLGEPGLAEREHAHVGDRVRLLIGGMEAGLTPTFCTGDPRHAARGGDSVVIGEADAAGRTSAVTVATKGETSFSARGGGEICLPFANGESALRAADLAVPLAARLKMPLFFYHATWRKEGLPPSAPPDRHMNDQAFEVFEILCAMADKAGVGHRTVVETATAVAEGTVRAALNAHCAMIVLARGRHVGCGSYVDQVLARSVMPVIVAGNEVSS